MGAKNIQKIVMRFLFLAATLILFQSCFVSKKKLRKQISQAQQELQKTTDSLTKINDSTSLHYENILRQQRQSGVIFETPKCPPVVNIDSACSKDSLVKVIRILQDQLANANNQVEFYSDGSFKASGRIKSANVQIDNLQQQIQDWKRKFDSVSSVKQQVITKTDTKTIEVDRSIKRNSIILLLLIVFVFGVCVGCYYWEKRGTKTKATFKGFLKHFFGKITLL